MKVPPKGFCMGGIWLHRPAVKAYCRDMTRHDTLPGRVLKRSEGRGDQVPMSSKPKEPRLRILTDAMQ